MYTLLLTLVSGFFILLPLVFSSRTDELFEFNKIVLLYVGTILICGTWACRMLLEKKVFFRPTRLLLPWLFFLGSQLISTVLSIDPRTSVFGYYSRFNGGLLSSVCYALLYFAVVSNFGRKDMWRIGFSAIIGASLAALYALPEHFGGSPSCLLITGSFDVACWVQDVRNRVFGTFGQPNWLAAYLIAFLPIGGVLSAYTWQTKRWQSIGYLCLTALFFSVLLFTNSRSGILGLVGGLTFLILTSLVYTFRQRHYGALKNVNLRPIITPLAIWVTIVILLFLAVGSNLRSALLNSAGHLLPKSTEPTITQATPSENASAPSGTQLEVGGTESGVIRSIVWSGAIAVWKRYPIFGSGVETFAYSYYQDRPQAHNLVSEWDFLYNKAHNELLNFLATTGVVGLCTYLALILFPFVIVMWQRIQREPKKSNYFVLLGLLAGLVGVHISNFLGFSTVAVSAVLFSLFPAWIFIELDSSESAEKVSFSWERVTGEQWFGIAGILLFSLFLLWSVKQYWLADVDYSTGKRLTSTGDSAGALSAFQSAIQRTPAEPTFRDEYSVFAARLAVTANQEKQATLAAQLAQIAILESDTTLQQNPRHLNFYKSRAKVFILLGSLEPQFYQVAYDTLQAAHKLSPTDPKITYNLGVLANEAGNTPQAVYWLEKTVQLRPTYIDAQKMLDSITRQK